MADNVTIPATGTGTSTPIVATDERSIAGVTAHIQRVGELGSSAIASGQVAVTSTSSNIVAARDTRKRVTIVNSQTVPVWIGPTSVASNTGLRLDPGAAVSLTTAAAVSGVTSAAYTAAGIDDRVMFVEEFDA